MMAGIILVPMAKTLVESQVNPAISEGIFHDISNGTNEQNETEITKFIIDPAENDIPSNVTKVCYGSIFDISSVGVFLTSVFVTAFYPARGDARARGETEVRPPQCNSTELPLFSNGSQGSNSPFQPTIR